MWNDLIGPKRCNSCLIACDDITHGISWMKVARLAAEMEKAKRLALGDFVMGTKGGPVST